jgi:parallel beta-helix repeat protein
VLTRITIAAGTLGVSLAFAGTALAAPSPMHHAGRPAAHRQTIRHSVKPATSGGAKLYVNGGSGNDQSGANTCRLSSNPCATITHAIAVAPSTATIEVAGGTYNEQLAIVGKNLTINGAGSTRTIIDPTSLNTDNNDPNSTGPQAVIVEFLNTSGGGLSNVEVNGAGSGSSEPSDGSCDQDFVGVEFANSSGTLSSDAVTGVQEQQNYFGCQQGLSVYVGNASGTDQTVKMTGLSVTKYQKDGIDCDGNDTTCTISGSTVTGIGATGLTAQNGIETDNGVNATISKNTVTDNSYTSPNYTSQGIYYTASGILVYDSNTVSISGNTVNNNDDNIAAYEDGSFAGPASTWSIKTNKVTAGVNNTGGAVPLGFGVGDGIDLEGVGQMGSGQSAVVTADVAGNTVEDNADWGIALFGTTGATIGGSTSTAANNASSNADDGIWLGEFSPGIASTDNTVQKNTASNNGDDGILAAGADSSGDQQATGNSFTANVMKNDTRYDAEDLSSDAGLPAGTSGTANFWMGDKCTPVKDSSPLGLCS